MIAGHSLSHLLWPSLVPIHSFPKLCLILISSRGVSSPGLLLGNKTDSLSSRKPSIPVGQESWQLVQTERRLVYLC